MYINFSHSLLIYIKMKKQYFDSVLTEREEIPSEACMHMYHNLLNSYILYILHEYQLSPFSFFFH